MAKTAGQKQQSKAPEGSVPRRVPTEIHTSFPLPEGSFWLAEWKLVVWWWFRPGATESQPSVTDSNIANSSFPAANEAADETLVSSGGPPAACELSAGMHSTSLALSHHLFLLSLPGSWSLLGIIPGTQPYRPESQKSQPLQLLLCMAHKEGFLKMLELNGSPAITYSFIWQLMKSRLGLPWWFRQ